MSADDNGTAPTDGVPEEIAAAHLATVLVEHVRRCRNMVDAWQREHPTTTNYRINQARSALRMAELALNKAITGKDAELEQARAAHRAAFPDEEYADTPQPTQKAT